MQDKHVDTLSKAGGKEPSKPVTLKPPPSPDAQVVARQIHVPQHPDRTMAALAADLHLPALSANIRENYPPTSTETIAGFHPERLDPYRKVFDHMLGALEQHPIMDTYSGTKVMEGEFDGKTYIVRDPHLRRGNNAFVGIVDITNPDGTTFTSVVKNRPDEAREFLEKVKTKPVMAEYVPGLYGVMGGWAVIERLFGIELHEIVSKVEADPSFLQNYAKHAADLMLRTAQAKLALNDVKFVNGWNVMVDPSTMATRLIEQGNLDPRFYRLPSELITQQLLFELDQAVHSSSSEEKKDFVFALLKELFEHEDPHSLYVRAPMVMPTHPKYRSAYNAMQFKDITDEEFQRRLHDPVLREKPIPYMGSLDTTVLSDPLIASVRENNPEAFVMSIANGGYRTLIKDPNDSRFAPVVIPDDQI